MQENKVIKNNTAIDNPEHSRTEHIQAQKNHKSKTYETQDVYQCAYTQMHNKY